MNTCGTYGTFDAQLLFGQKPEAKFLSDQDLFFLARQERVSENRGEWEVYFEELCRRVNEYNQQEPVDKPPYALRYEVLPPGPARDMVILNIVTLEDSFGCPNKCSWCARNAPRINGSELLLMPIEQEKHFMKEKEEIVGRVVNGHEASDRLVRGAMRMHFWDMGDPLSHPDALERIKFAFQEFGVKPFAITTALPAHAETNVYKLASVIAYSQHKEKGGKFPRELRFLENLVALRKTLEVFYSGSLGVKVSDVKEVYEASKDNAKQFLGEAGDVYIGKYLFVLSKVRGFIEQLFMMGEASKENFLASCSNWDEHVFRPNSSFFRDEEEIYPTIGEAFRFFGFEATFEECLDPEKYQDLVCLLEASSKKISAANAVGDGMNGFDRYVEGAREIVMDVFGIEIEDLKLNGFMLFEFKEAIRERNLKGVDEDLLGIPGLEESLMVSHTKGNDGRFRDLKTMYDVELPHERRDVDPYWKSLSAGHGFFKDSEPDEIGSVTGGLKSGMVLTPGGLMNVAERMLCTSDQQCGRLEAPFKGLEKGMPLLEVGDDLHPILDRVVVVGGSRGVFGSILVFDGDYRIRHIKFHPGFESDRAKLVEGGFYKPLKEGFGTVLSDTVVAEGVSEISDEVFKFRGALMKECETCENPCFGLVVKGMDANEV